MQADFTYCASSYLMLRTVFDRNKCFKEGVVPKREALSIEPTMIEDSFALEKTLREKMKAITEGKKAALALSGGIDSAILARMMPEGSMTYTFKCVVPGIEVTDETKGAKKIAAECGLKNEVVEIYFEDVEKYAPILMKRKGAPIHSIEVQIYKAALKAKEDGFDTLIFGESADCLYGGLSGLLSKDWTVGEFIDRYSYVKPYHALKNFEMVTEPFYKFEKDGYIDTHGFLQNVFFNESTASYLNAAKAAGIEVFMPYAETRMAVPLDIERVRGGENKYIVREIFQRLYEGFQIPPKTPMPRPTNEWFKDWTGPERSEFWPKCAENMTGDQKWLVYCLAKFMDLMDEGKI